MKRKPLLSLAVVLLVAFGGLLTTLIAGWRPLLGLDLQGGASVVLQPDRKTDASVLDETIGIIRSRVDALGVSEPEIYRQGDAIVVQLPGVKDQARALKIVGQTAELRFRPVLSEVPSEAAIAAQAKAAATAAKTSTTIKGGTTTTVAAGASTTVKGAATAPTTAPVTTTAGATTTAAVTTTAAPGLVAAPARFGSFAVRAQTTSTPAATTAAPTTAAPTTAPPTTAAPTTVAGSATTVAGSATTIAGTATTIAGSPTTVAPIVGTSSYPTNLDTTPIKDDTRTATVVLPLDKRSPTSSRLLLGPAELTGEVVSDAQAILGNSGTWEVQVTFNSAGSAAWDAMANRYYQQRIGIVLDGVVKSAPSINARSFGGTAIISGNFTANDAKDLATSLRFGSLPVQLTAATQQTVSATLGRDSLHAGIVTGGIGLLLVALYMVAYYRSLGLVAIAGLSMAAILMWVTVSVLSRTKGLTLSLSGAVGIIVSVGITVDSYVVYFERIRDELRAGRTLKTAAERGFIGAWHTILAGGATSFIGAFVLYLLTVGSVRGFAYFLMISTVLDILVAYFFAKPLVSALAKTNFFLSGPMRISTEPVRARSSVGDEAPPSRLTPGVGSARSKGGAA